MDHVVISRLNRLVLFLAACFFVYDITVDLGEGDPLIHFVPEATIFILVLVVLAYEIATGIRLRSQVGRQEQHLSELKGAFSDRIRDQFTRWNLTPSETEVAWLIVKGFSFVEIARLRGVKDKTVRQQATAIYAKSDTGNRSDFTAGFIEDLIANDQ